ncbi:hypothetical protein C4569_01160 [Candidatus Parcubacteria bacterium]|nr:MAG: hypothetical protein C4569_01160 [Candidatus Parcubacteria bacterium]
MEKSQHPDQVTITLVNKIEKISSSSFVNGAKYQEEREELIACMMAYGLRKVTKKEWFILKPPQQDSSDFILTSMSNDINDDNPFERASFQQVELPTRIAVLNDKLGEIKKIIDKKFGKYSDEHKLRLLIFINFENSHLFQKEIIAYVRKKQEEGGKFIDVWLFALTASSLIKGYTFRITRAFPIKYYDSFTANLVDEFNKGIIYDDPRFKKFLIKSP